MTKIAQNFLLIDDDPINNLINKRKLEKHQSDLGIFVMESAKDALVFLKDNNNPIPDIILLDINMPEMSGWEFLEEFKKLQLSSLVVILTSSINYEDLEKSKKEDSIKSYIVKPLDDEKLKNIFQV